MLGDPVFYALAGALLEGYAEGAVAAVTAAGGQLLGLDGLALGRLRAICENRLLREWEKPVSLFGD